MCARNIFLSEASFGRVLNFQESVFLQPLFSLPGSTLTKQLDHNSPSPHPNTPCITLNTREATVVCACLCAHRICFNLNLEIMF